MIQFICALAKIAFRRANVANLPVGRGEIGFTLSGESYTATYTSSVMVVRDTNGRFRICRAFDFETPDPVSPWLMHCTARALPDAVAILMQSIEREKRRAERNDE